MEEVPDTRSPPAAGEKPAAGAPRRAEEEGGGSALGVIDAWLRQREVRDGARLEQPTIAPPSGAQIDDEAAAAAWERARAEAEDAALAARRHAEQRAVASARGFAPAAAWAAYEAEDAPRRPPARAAARGAGAWRAW